MNVVDASSLPALEYLTQTGVNAELKQMLTNLLEAQPDDPITFITDHLKNSLHRFAPVYQAYTQINLGNWNSPSYNESVAQAFESLNAGNKGDILTGIEMSDFTNFLNYFLRGYERIQASFYKIVLGWTDHHELVSFEAFRDITLLAGLLEEFLKQIKLQYQKLSQDSPLLSMSLIQNFLENVAQPHTPGHDVNQFMVRSKFYSAFASESGPSFMKHSEFLDWVSKQLLQLI
ncbi:uncharacterized protein BJ171DRAFT_625276 [Polychytrium aggregatum]|uniref:uncharacterized protein n=1 Tax=Polychytrium aggregatum TaxID=110093 RepID=UPI0022FDBB10|nr:uncharacterized protein BJ171DRAFT_625276 [Polychytrium aggregatum]KAI9202937.1 hypothetical protein BJ171DRAFT_625276 [Polychytrium aggregatum]